MDTIDALKIAKEKGWTYDPKTGEVFTHKGKLLNGRLVQKNQTYILGRVTIGFKETKTIYAHQFGYYYMTGETPEMIDHIEHHEDPIYNNRFHNLRASDRVKNSWNRPSSKGYSFEKSMNKWRAYIRVDKKLIRLGNFEKEEDARIAYLEAKKIYHVL
jgi:hypothetical protein